MITLVGLLIRGTLLSAFYFFTSVILLDVKTAKVRLARQ
jgi:hypothetical protein